ncbi:hypothetical protein COCSADRAFT_355211 [Bipolaris sorokiniana ND90Pr]|uniref:DUF1996 domain-containing protein n=1 Tax=Cochliobolus sativus (strain ND90Pr / ATCC 201652) TaxID=665912 RepID=M2TA81_COCSN|nr:uncharacterized protein COCSADRAFT_355211 [Bipolaris sorokiniana ND90Pr]EMD65827.1 hypothetical protein COCSADRAFT_355211 [Bipolaris sorokiniana ND90Pr]
MAPRGSSKIEKTHSKGDKSTAKALEQHEAMLTKLEEEKEDLDNEVYQGMYTEEHQAKQNAVETQLQKYTSAASQVNVKKGPIPESTEPMNLDDAEQMAKKETSATNPAATQPDVATHALDPKKTYAGDQQQSSGYGEMKKELIDNLNMKWDIDVNDSRGESSMQHLPKEVFGHIMKSSRTRYCVRYGSKEGLSARFESILPNASDYNQERDVTQGSDRIVEKIVQHHRDNKTALPMHILSQVKVLVVYWDSKRGVGHEAEVEVLAPDFKERRPHTRCFIWLDPQLYSEYKLNNQSGWSHETRTTIKLVMDGIDDREKSIALYNIAVDLENKFEERWMSHIPGRPEPLSKLIYERKAVSRRTKQPVTTTEPLVRPTPMKPPVLHRQPTPLVKPQQEQTPIKTEPGMSPRDQFHKDFLELFDLPEDYTYYFLFGDKIMAFPPGFRMIAGDASRKNVFVPPPDIPQSLWGPEEKAPKSLAEKAIGFNCLNYSGAAEGALSRHLLPNKSFIDSNCADGLRLELMFPSCWDGISLDANDHKSHVAYPDLVMEGTCPPDYETRIPALFFETIWDTSVFRNASGQFLLSNGDQAGTKRCLLIKP